MKELKIDVCGLTDPGPIKEVNQDSFFYKVVKIQNSYYGIFAVADGVGGLKRGELASAMAINYLVNWWEKEFKAHYDEKDYLLTSLKETISKANQGIMNMAVSKGIKMATTLSIVLILSNEGYIFHIGDSRVYHYSSRMIATKLAQVTPDHSCLVPKKVNNEVVYRSVLTDCVGYRDTYKLYDTMIPLKKDSMLLLCSDGVYKKVNDTQIEIMLKSYRNDLAYLCSEIIALAKKLGETDNISIIAIRIDHE